LAYEVIALLVFGILILGASKGLHTQGNWNNRLHWGLIIVGIVVLGTGLVFALPHWFEIFRFPEI
jgi:cytochrome c biogenesis protein CcdA